MNTAEAFEVIKQAMIDDDPSKPGSYAHSWHCNIAMMCYDAIIDEYKGDAIDHSRIHRVSNEAASRFMVMLWSWYKGLNHPQYIKEAGCFTQGKQHT